jgi:CBS domain-containing protein
MAEEEDPRSVADPGEGQKTQGEDSKGSAAAENASDGQAPAEATRGSAVEEPTKDGDGTPSASAESTDGDEEAIEPEPYEASTTTRPHHPPPPPSLRHNSNNPKGVSTKLELAKTPKLAQDLMSRQLFTTEPETPLGHLEEQMDRFRFSHLPVVDGDKLVGLITHGDLLHASSSFLSERAEERDELIHRVPASRIMQTELISVRPTEELAEVAKLIWEGRLGCVPVTSEDGKLLGIVTKADFVRLSHHLLTKRSED